MPCLCELKVERQDEKVQCAICNEIFHAKCAGFTKNDLEYLEKSKQNFNCKKCIINKRTNTQQQIQTQSDINVATKYDENNQNQKQSTTINAMPTVEKLQQQEVRNELQSKTTFTPTHDNNKKRKLTEIETTLNNQINMVDLTNMIHKMGREITSEIKKELNNTIIMLKENIDKLTTQVADLTEQNKIKETKIINLEHRINVLEQKTLDSNITIKNLEIKEGESLCTAVQSFAKTINVDLTPDDIVDIYSERRQNNIVLKLSTIRKKREIMTNAKKKITTTPTGTRIFVNDQLSPHNKKLLWLAKIAAKESSWKFVWVKGGQIYAKQDETTKFFYINKEEDINNIK